MKKGGLKAAFRARSSRAGAYSALAALLVIAIAVTAVLAVSALPSSMTQLDLTQERLYSISAGTEQMLAALTQDVDIYWLVQTGSEDGTMQQVLSKYAEFSHVHLTQVDPELYPGFAEAYTDEQVTNNSVIVASGERSMYIPYSDIWTYSDYDTYANYLYSYGMDYRDTFAGEGKLTNAVRAVTSEEQPAMYFLEGHGEQGPSDAVLDDIALENVRTEKLNLVSAGSVPEDCAALGIVGPERDLSEEELQAVLDYVDGGGRVLLATTYTSEDMPNLDALLDALGLSLRRGVVMEGDSSRYQYGWIDLVLPTLGEHDITAPLRDGSYTVMMPDAQAFTALDEDGDVTVTALATTSDSSYLKEDLQGTTSYERAEDDPAGPFMLAAVSENEQTGAEAVVFGSASFMEPEFSDAVAGANLDFFLNAVDELCAQEDAISIHPKVVSSERLTFADNVGSALKLAMTVLVPAAFLLFGTVLFIRRRRR